MIKFVMSEEKNYWETEGYEFEDHTDWKSRLGYRDQLLPSPLCWSHNTYRLFGESFLSVRNVEVKKTILFTL